MFNKVNFLFVIWTMMESCNRLFIISLCWIAFTTDLRKWFIYMLCIHVKTLFEYFDCKFLNLQRQHLWKCVIHFCTIFILFDPTAKFRPHWWGGCPDRCYCARRGPPRPHQQLPLQCRKWAGHPLQWHSCAREPPCSTGLPDNYKGW